MAESAQKERYGDRAQRRMYPMGTLNSACARPLSWLFAKLRFTPNMVSVLSLLVSLAGCVLVATAWWGLAAAGAGLVHLGLLLDHADGQVARRRRMGSDWGAYLDMVIDRVVECGVLLALGVAAARSLQGPGWLPTPWAPLGRADSLLLAGFALATLACWRYLTAYNDLLLLRRQLLTTGKLPARDARPQALTRRPVIPLVWSRDWMLLFAVLGVLAAQPQATLVVLMAVHGLLVVERVIVFKARHKSPEGDAARILGKDYH